MRPRRSALLAALALSACSVDGGPVVPTDLFDPDRVVTIDLELAAGDWDTLRFQTRSWLEVHAACLAAPFPSPFTAVPTTATIDGVRLDGATVRKKGFLGSLSVDKPSLKLALADGRRLTLNNSQQDDSYVRTCLSYQLFAAAGLPAPRCNFAHVRVNGDDLGLYVHVEQVDRAFLAAHFDDGGGNLYEGTYSDFRAGWTATFELETNQSTGDRRDLDAVVAALERPDGELLEAVEAVIAIEPLLASWAVEVLITHRDGYAGNANNFFAYHDPTSDRFHLVPWGADTTFIPGPDPFGTGVVSVHVGSIAPWRLYRIPAARDRYVATLRALLDDVWDEDALVAELDRMAALIAPIADPDGNRGLAGHVAEVRRFVRGRRAAILAELDAGPPASTSPLDEPPCAEPIGELRGSLRTTWGTTIADAFAAGSGAITGTLDEVALEVGSVGAAASSDPDAQTKTRIVVTGVIGPDIVVVVFQADAAHVRADARLSIDGVEVTGTVYRYAPSAGTYTLVGLIVDGALDVTAFASTAGAPVTATFHGAVVRTM